MHLSSISPTTLTRTERALRAKYSAVIDFGEDDMTVTVALTHTDDLIIAGSTLRAFDRKDKLLSAGEKDANWSVTFAAVPDATPPLVNPIPTSVETGFGDYDTAKAFSLGGKLAAFGLFVAGGVLKRLNGQPAASDKPTVSLLPPRVVAPPAAAPVAVAAAVSVKAKTPVVKVLKVKPAPARPTGEHLGEVIVAHAARKLGMLTPEGRKFLLDDAVARLGMNGKAIEVDTGLSHGYVQRSLARLRASAQAKAAAKKGSRTRQVARKVQKKKAS